ncbi:RyR domain-containing protein [Methanobrevibacter sp.]|uniref:RyR domain-containing protein n=1 Tax=Methanobrevibacter sp. TaxID=66852 RepID=UPI002E78EDFA|nr:RyR domain-containing protein [Methanobrevibacter sp.]MEE1336935.1 RyR domain-containing protein [Methanobrevibacter sp.]
MEWSKEQMYANFVKYINCRNNLFNSLAYTFKGFIFENDSNRDYPSQIFDGFLNFKRDANLVLDFEFSEMDFEIFDVFGFSQNHWISIYKLFSEVFNRDAELDTFINLFFLDLIYSGPFGEDIKGLDMCDELLDLMGEDVMKLYILFDEYFNTRNPDLIKDIVEVCKSESIPYFMVEHLADWISDDIEDDDVKRSEFGEIACELYAVGVNKMYRKPVLFNDDLVEISGFKGSLEMTRFSEVVIEKTFSKMNSNNNVYLNEGIKIVNNKKVFEMTDKGLKEYIDDFFNQLELYDDYHNGHHYKGLLKAGIDVFLEKETAYNAYEIYQTFFMIYQITAENKSDKVSKNSIVSEPNTLLDLVKIMKKYEENTGDLIEKQRDHFIHSVNVFLLGLAIYSQNKNYRDMFEAYVTQTPYKKYYRINGKFSHEEFLYRWGVAALFHDIGYPVEIIGKQLNKFVNDSVKSISSTYGADTAIDFKDFEEFNTIVKIEPDFADQYTKNYPKAKFLNLFKPTDIMAQKIAVDFPKVDVNKVAKHLDEFVDIMGENGFIDHGFFSAILVLNSYGYLIQKYAKNHDFFFYPIVDSATAILLHNYYRNVLKKEPFNLPAMHPIQNPLAYLLILCDELQEWNRQPFGIKDKARSHVNDLNIIIDDTRLEVDYIVKSGSMGLGFSEDKEELLKNVLSIPSIFERGLLVFTKVDHDNNIMREIVKSEIQAPNTLLRNVEKLALQIHQQYIETTTAQYNKEVAENALTDETKNKFEGLTDFDGLSSHLKLANIRQARSIPKKLQMIGCELANENDARKAISKFSEQEIIDLAIIEHDDWCEEKISQGWTYGPERNDDELIHDCLVPWDDLPEKIQQYDIDPVKNIPKLVDSVGLKIVRSKVRMLTIEMHKFYQSKETDAEDFEDLPDYIKYSNYKQTDFLVKILTELGYNVVDKEAPGEAIDAFDEDELRFLAKREHNAWYKLKVNLGWKYGPARDNDKKINPNLVEWDILDVKTKEINKRTFRNLPYLCNKVDLKIVKN